MKIQSDSAVYNPDRPTRSIKGGEEVALSSPQHRLHSTFLIKNFFDFAFLFCLSPFHLQLAQKSPTISFSMRGYWLHKVICVSLTFLSSLWLLREFRLNPTGRSRHPSTYFKLLAYIVDTFLKVVTIKEFWMNGKDVVKLINFIGNHIPAEKSCTLKSTKILGYFLAVCFSLLGFVRWISGAIGLTFTSEANNNGTNEQWTLIRWWDSNVEAGRYNLFFQDFPCHHHTLNTVLGVLAVLGHLHRRLLGLYTDYFLLIMTLTLYLAVKHFINDLYDMSSLEDSNFEGDSTSWLVVHQKFRQLQKLSRQINSIIGTNVTTLVAQIMLYCATSLDEIFYQPGGGAHFRVMILASTYVDYAAILVISVRVVYEVRYNLLFYSSSL